MNESATPYPADPLPELLKQRQPLNWLVEHWVETGTLALLVGAEGSFKSFLSVDWAMSVATGRAWHGCRVKQGRVLYIAGEGRSGVIRRMRGWSDHHGTSAGDILLGRSPIELIDARDADRIAELGSFDVVVIDTLARNFGRGSENDQKDMGAAIKHADRIREATGATVLVVHHAPLEGRDEGKLRPRGSSALAGAADAIFTCQYDKDAKVVKVTSTKQKDAPNPDTRFFASEVVDVGETDNFGNAITTVVLCETHKRPAQKKALGKNQKRLVRGLRLRANGGPELRVSMRDVTNSLNLSRESRGSLEKWLNDQPWCRPSAGGEHIIDLEQLPHG